MGAGSEHEYFQRVAVELRGRGLEGGGRVCQRRQSGSRTIADVLTFIVFAATLEASTPAARATATAPSAVASPAQPHDLSGHWITSTEMPGPEPGRGAVSFEEPCFASFGGLAITPGADGLLATWSPSSRVQGALPAFTTREGETLHVTVDGTHVRLSGEYAITHSRSINPDVRVPPPPPPKPVEYDLTLDEKSGHLRGTRNGAPFWAARLLLRKRSASCGSPPP